MKFGRSTALHALLVVGALTVSGCGADSHGLAAIDDPAAGVDCGGKQQLRAGGSTSQVTAMEQFAYAYSRACPGRALVYNSTGTTAGVDDFITGELDLAGSESALDPAKTQPERAAERCGSPAWNLPVVFAPVAVTFRLTGVNTLNLDGPTLAKIFNGTIGSWDNPAIKALNAGVALPALPIHVVYRADRAPSTATFQRYLDIASDGAWFAGGGDLFNGGIGEAATGNSGTVAALQANEGSISYHEWSFAVGKKLPMAQFSASTGAQPVAISVESVGKTISGSKFVAASGPDASANNDLVLDMASIYRPGEPGAYPIVSANYQIVCSKYPDAAVGTAVRAFLQAAVGPGQAGLDQFGSIPLPESFKSRILTAVNAIS